MPMIHFSPVLLTRKSFPEFDRVNVRAIVDAGSAFDLGFAFQRRAPDEAHNPNALALFGGGKDEGEDVREAVVRELKEELPGFRFDWLDPVCGYDRFYEDTGKRALDLIAVAYGHLRSEECREGTMERLPCVSVALSDPTLGSTPRHAIETALGRGVIKRRPVRLHLV